MVHILVIEDSPDFVQMIRATLGRSYDVLAVGTLADARRALGERPFELILLDVSLPDGSGFDFYAEVRAECEAHRSSVIFLSGRDEVQDRITGWALGADDYITKPFAPAEFRARIANRVDRLRASLDQDRVMQWADLTVNLTFHEASVVVGGARRPLELTPIEFKLLFSFLKNADRVLSRGQLITTAWGTNVNITERTVDKHISMLRQKLVASRAAIKTVSGLGYRLVRTAA